MSVTISRQDLERMRRLALDEKPASHLREEKNKLLRDLSLAKRKNWLNTLEAIRDKKLNNRREREEKKEFQYQEIDRIEAEFRKNQRFEAIQKANELLYEQTDKMKFLRTQQHYADVLVYRRQQVDEKNQYKEHEKEMEAEFHQSTMKQVEEGRQLELKAHARRQDQIKQVSKSRTEQLEEAYMRKTHEAEEQRKLGEALKQAAIQRLQVDLDAREKKAKEIRDARKKTLEKNAELREEKKQMERVEEDAERQREREIEIIAERKKAREDLEKFRFEQAQVNRQKIIDKAVELLAQKLNNDEEIAEKQDQEFKAKEKARDDAKEARAKQQWEQTVESRNYMVANRKAKELQLKEEGIRIAQEARIHAAAALAHDEEIQKKIREQNKAIKAAQLRDAAQKKKETIENEIRERERLKILMQQEANADEKFEKICKAEIIRYKAEGKPTVTLLKALRFKQPEIIPALEVKRGV